MGQIKEIPAHCQSITRGYYRKKVPYLFLIYQKEANDENNQKKNHWLF